MPSKQDYQEFKQAFDLLSAKNKDLKEIISLINILAINKGLELEQYPEEYDTAKKFDEEIIKALKNPLYKTLAKGDINKQFKEIKNNYNKFISSNDRDYRVIYNLEEYNGKELEPVYRKNSRLKITKTFRNNVLFEDFYLDKKMKAKIINKEEYDKTRWAYIYKFKEGSFDEEEKHLKMIEKLLKDQGNFSTSLENITEILNTTLNLYNNLEAWYNSNKNNEDLEELEEETKEYLTYKNMTINNY